MISVRFIFLSAIYFYLYYKEFFNDKYYYQSMISLFFVTSFFMFLVKIYDNMTVCKNKETKFNFVIARSIFYGFISLAARAFYLFLIEPPCSQLLFNMFEKIEWFKYIPESMFIAGMVLLLNKSSELLFDKCDD